MSDLNNFNNQTGDCAWKVSQNPLNKIGFYYFHYLGAFTNIPTPAAGSFTSIKWKQYKETKANKTCSPN